MKECGISRHRKVLLEIYFRFLRYGDPGRAIKNKIRVNDGTIMAGESYIPLNGDLYVVSCGKCALNMYESLMDVISAYAGRVKRSLVIYPGKDMGVKGRAIFLGGEHPLPGERSFRNGKYVYDMLRRTNADDVVVLLLSGGASSLMCYPVEGITPEYYRQVVERIMSSGGNIYELNAVRSAMDMLKGGGFARAAYPSRVVALISSDVIGADPSVIGSGPACSPPEDVERVIKIHGLNISTVRYEYPENAENHIIVSNEEAIASTVRDMGEKYRVRVISPLTGPVDGDVVRFIDEVLNHEGIVICGGEMTSNYSGGGVGGRNHHAAALTLKLIPEELSEGRASFLYAGSDGRDGSSPCTGAFADRFALNMLTRDEIENSLLRYDTYNLMKKARASLCTGPTGVNVADIYAGVNSI